MRDSESSPPPARAPALPSQCSHYFSLPTAPCIRNKYAPVVINTASTTVAKRRRGGSHAAVAYTAHETA